MERTRKVSLARLRPGSARPRSDSNPSWIPTSAAQVEEGHLTSLALPFGLQFRLGKLKVPFGKLNTLHTHVWLSVTPPLAMNLLFGAEGWKDTGGQLAWLLPLPTFHELTVAALRGNSDVGFAAAANKRFAALAHLRNFFPVGDDLAFEIGGSAAEGPTADCDRCKKQLGGADFTLRWKPLESNVRHSVTIQAETIWIKTNALDANNLARPGGWLPADGFWVLLDLQPGLRWHFAARYDRAREGEERLRGFSAIVNFWPSEFSNFKIEYRRMTAGGESWNEGHLYTQILLGAHGAHPY